MNDSNFFFVALFAYLVGMIVYTTFIAFENRILSRIASAIMILGFITHTIALSTRWIRTGIPPLSGLYEFASLFAWTIVLGYLIILITKKLHIVGAFVAPVAFILIVIASLVPKSESERLVPALQSYWLQIHVSLAVFGDGAFAVAFASSVLYLIKQYSKDNKESSLNALLWGIISVAMLCGGVFTALLLKFAHLHLPTPGQHLFAFLGAFFGLSALLGSPIFLLLFTTKESIRKKIPNIDLLDDISYKAISIGYPLFTVGALLAGAIWAYKTWGAFWSWDPKEVGSLIVWLVFSVYLHARYVAGWRGNRTAIIAIIGFLCAVLTMVGNLVLGGLHSYL